MQRFQKPPKSLVEIMQSVIGNSTQSFYLGIRTIPSPMDNRLKSTSSQERISLRCNELPTHYVTSSLSKVFEKLVHKHLYSYLESNNLPNHRNSGFRKNHSRLTSLLKTTHDIYLAHDHNLSSRIM